MSADANSAYGKPWFKRAANPQAATQSNPTATPQQAPTQSNQPIPAQPKSDFVAHVYNAQTKSGTIPAGSASAFSSDAATSGNLRTPKSAAQQPGLGSTFGAPAPRSTAAQTAVAAQLAEQQYAAQLPSILAGVQERMQHALTDQVTPLRLASHLSVLLVAAAVLLFSRIQIPEWDFQLVAMPEQSAPSRQFGSVAQQMSALLTVPSANSAEALASESLQVQIVPFTIIPERTRREIQVYAVQGGDTVLGIAGKFKVQPETLLWANPALENNPDLLRINDQLRILPVDGVLHTVKAGDSLSALASTYKVDVAEIIAYESNNLSDANAPLIIGTDIVVPGGTKPYITRQVVGMGVTAVPVPSSVSGATGNFGWPSSGSISQNYWGGHPALDIASRTGAAVKAADGGFVTVAGGGWNGGYGNHVIIDHGNGFVTTYAHLNTIFVKAGESVGAGQQIGTVGNTGNSTGPHLHFEIRYQGYPRNPYNYLP